MGFNVDAIKFLLAAKAEGVRFSQAATIGRQGLHVSFSSLRETLRLFDIRLDDKEIEHLFEKEDGFAEPFLRLLDAQEVCSIDASTYEGSTVCHDMNLPIPDELKNRFSVVIDGGSLEHVFDFPRAIKNVMEMVQVGGHFLGFIPANNFLGHGFYQFSPELFFRVFNEENGFTVEHMYLVTTMARAGEYESPPRANWYQIVDPKQARHRAEVQTRGRTNLLVQAKRVDSKPIFSSVPLQSDYVALWSNGRDSPRVAGEGDAPWRMAIKSARRLVPKGVKRLVRRAVQVVRLYRAPKLNPDVFRRVDMSSLYQARRQERRGP